MSNPIIALYLVSGHTVVGRLVAEDDKGYTIEKPIRFEIGTNAQGQTVIQNLPYGGALSLGSATSQFNIANFHVIDAQPATAVLEKTWLQATTRIQVASSPIAKA